MRGVILKHSITSVGGYEIREGRSIVFERGFHTLMGKTCFSIGVMGGPSYSVAVHEIMRYIQML